MKKIIFLFFIVNKLAIAQNEIVTDRPDVTEAALTIPIQSIQLETGMTFSSEQNIKSNTVPEYLIRVGVLKFLELRFEHAFYKTIASDSKLNNSDLFIGIKAQLLKKEKFKIAFLSHINLPENDRNNLLYVGKLLLSYEITTNDEIAVNVGVNALNNKMNGEIVYSIAYGRGVTDKIGFYLENYGNVANNNLTAYVDGGFSYLLKSKIQLDTKFGIDTQFFKDYFIGAGISIRFFN